MRKQIIKLKKHRSTKGERRFMEICKRCHIPFRAKIKIGGREVDFLIGKVAIEIDSHSQDVEKNYMLIELGYSPIHFNSWEIDVYSDSLEEWLINIWLTCQEQDYSHLMERP
jgi:very-short-patch-repair endonuclease